MEASVRFAIDTGGTFTDLAVDDGEGGFHQFKTPTTPSDPVEGLLEVLRVAAAHFDMTRRELLARGETLIHGTTRAINAIVTGTVARTAFFTTWGQPEILVNREGGKTKPFDAYQAFPEPYIPRALTFEIPERIAWDGEIVRPLDEEESTRIISGLSAMNIEAIGVCLLFSTINPVHELRIGELLEEHLPGMPFTLSHQINPTLREYRRASATVIDASLKPVMSEYLHGLEDRLREAGFGGRLLVSTSGGGVFDAVEAAEAPIHTLNSGPAMAPVAGRAIAGSETGHSTVIVADAGGTTYDVSLVQRGRIPTTAETWIGPQYTGHMTGFPSVDIRSVGAGGGSIAWVDQHGLLHVGPRSAGADPGPICYARGGVEPTVTDACLVLGYLDPEYFLGGAMALDVEAARAALEELGERMRLDTQSVAHAVLEVATENMIQAIEGITINQGIDPARAVLIAGGGAAGLSASIVGRRLRCDKVVVPQLGGVLSAVGMLLSDLVAEFGGTLVTSTESFDYDGVNAMLAGLEAKAQRFIDAAGAEAVSSSITFSAEARYPDQIWELPVVLGASRFAKAADVEALRQGFHDIHHEVFAVSDAHSPVEIVGWRVRAECRLHDSELAARGEIAEMTRKSRRAWFPALGEVLTPVLDFSALAEEEPIPGPALVESPLTTVVVDPLTTAMRSPLGNLLLSPGSTARL
jgi:N-methylhydantoinase A